MGNIDVSDDSIIASKFVEFAVGGHGPWKLAVPKTVYPPREDTRLLAEAILSLGVEPSTAVEVGCGSGVLSILLAEMGWDVFAFDVNPYAVASARLNVDEHGQSERVIVNEGGVGEQGWEILGGTKLLVWNLPYLNPDEEAIRLEPIEEASMTDIPNGGWSAELMKHVNSHDEDGFIVVLLMRSDPRSPSDKGDWVRNGWSCRVINRLRMGRERIESVAFWKPGSGVGAVTVEECDSTMTEAGSLPDRGWQRVRARSQTKGRGRGGSVWEFQEGDVAATWKLAIGDGSGIPHGLVQTAVGSAIAENIGCRTKWPNDLVDKSGLKIGGIIAESSSYESGMRVGVGINSCPRIVSERRVSGWSETLGDDSAEVVFRIIDASLSGIFEAVPGLPKPGIEFLVEHSWRGISSSLSEGAFPRAFGRCMRAVGLDESGGLILEDGGEVSVITDVDELVWSFPSGF